MKLDRCHLVEYSLSQKLPSGSGFDFGRQKFGKFGQLKLHQIFSKRLKPM